jgi:hypothetical protein
MRGGREGGMKERRGGREGGRKGGKKERREGEKECRYK